MHTVSHGDARDPPHPRGPPHFRMGRTRARPLDRSRHREQRSCRIPHTSPPELTLAPGVVGLLLHRRRHGAHLPGHDVLCHRLVHDVRRLRYVTSTFCIESRSPSRTPSAALAAVSFFRSLAGFGFPLFAPAMFAALGYGKGNTILAAFAVAVGCPA